jgi:nitrogen fixation-related uncharacterized protein
MQRIYINFYLFSADSVQYDDPDNQQRSIVTDNSKKAFPCNLF